MAERREIPPGDYTRLVEILKDSVVSPRLTNWEKQFVDEMQSNVDRYGQYTRVSDRMWTVVDQLERKIYAT